MNDLFERLAIRTYDENGKLLTTWDDSAGWLEDGVEQNEFGEWRMTQIFHPYTSNELEKIKMEAEKVALADNRRQLTLDEVLAFFLKNQLNTVDIPDQTSLRMLDYYPTFSDSVGKTVAQGYKFTYEGKLYKTLQSGLTIQDVYPPVAGTESLYVRIDLEHTGASYDPIPYEGNMVLENGKYYTQSDVVYLCNRDTGTAVYHNLVDLVGLYVDTV